MVTIFVVGDLHGYFDQYVRLLRDAALINQNHDWTGGTSRLWLIGDIFDRGPAGIECLSLTMQLQIQAKAAGGEVQSLLGNHEMMILCAYRMREFNSDQSASVRAQWLSWGGKSRDLDGLTSEQVDWLTNLPAMARLGDKLLIHSDALLYITLGHNIDNVNDAFKQVMLSPDIDTWMPILSEFSDRKAFSELSITGTRRAQSLLKYFGGKQIIHGHTPISFARNISPGSVSSAWSYASDLCLNVDGGIYLGGSGFIYQFEIPS